MFFYRYSHWPAAKVGQGFPALNVKDLYRNPGESPEKERPHQRPFSFEEITLRTMKRPSGVASSEATRGPWLIHCTLFAEVV
jgi:hypothetical protein